MSEERDERDERWAPGADEDETIRVELDGHDLSGDLRGE